ncbi:MAG: helix-turn-helix domain-containing protein [Elusimicrobiales bacterium]|nr:helix-turn-helix domain-containing protein [Elusimicrobiales bacterium]
MTYALRLHDLGVSVETICRKLGISRRTFYVWKGKHDTALMARLKVIEEENQKLRQDAGAAAGTERTHADIPGTDYGDITQ